MYNPFPYHNKYLIIKSIDSIYSGAVFQNILELIEDALYLLFSFRDLAFFNEDLFEQLVSVNSLPGTQRGSDIADVATRHRVYIDHVKRPTNH